MFTITKTSDLRSSSGRNVLGKSIVYVEEQGNYNNSYCNIDTRLDIEQYEYFLAHPYQN